MALTKNQKTKLSNATILWMRANETDLSDLLNLTSTQKRDALGPFVQADRDATIGVQAKMPTKRAAEDVELAQYVTDCNQVLQDLDDGIMREGG